MEQLPYYKFELSTRNVVPSEGLCDLLGIKKGNLTNEYIKTILNTHDQRTLAKTIFNTARSKQKGRCTVNAKHSDGTLMDLILDAIYVEQDNLILVAGSVMNITDIHSEIEFLKTKIKEHDTAIEENRQQAHFAYVFIKKFLRYLRWWGPIIGGVTAAITFLHKVIYEW